MCMCRTLMGLEIIYQDASVNQSYGNLVQGCTLMHCLFVVMVKMQYQCLFVAETSINVTLGKQLHTGLLCKHFSPFHID